MHINLYFQQQIIKGKREDTSDENRVCNDGYSYVSYLLPLSVCILLLSHVTKNHGDVISHPGGIISRITIAGNCTIH